MKLSSFLHTITWRDLPVAVQQQARRCLLDTVGAGIGGRQTELSPIIYNFASAAFGGPGARLWFDGRTVSPPGAALAHGMMIDALDIHDGFKPSKGHAGAAIVPATLASLAMPAGETVTGAELLTRLVIGYEIALRAAMALHATACDYHTSGAWAAVGCAALIARSLRLDQEQTRHALGIAEYHGPRSPMMRVIDHPTMLKDGAGWGAMAGVSAGLMAAGGFTGAPALTVEGAEVAHFWADLGKRWLLLEQYFKPYPVCYWAQAPVVAALALQRQHGLAAEAIRRITVYSFYNATRLTTRQPGDTQAAQYSLPFPVAAALVYQRLGASEVTGTALTDARVLGLAQRIDLVEDPALSARYPAERLCRIVIEMQDGARYESPLTEAPWSHEDPPSDAQLQAKFRDLAAGYLSPAATEQLASQLWHCTELPDAASLGNLLAQPVMSSE
jgi:2-methylcitrate dehydratase PrpD